MDSVHVTLCVCVVTSGVLKATKVAPCTGGLVNTPFLVLKYWITPLFALRACSSSTVVSV